MSWRVAALFIFIGGCDDAEPDACLSTDATVDCAPLYDPEFSEIHARTLAPSCAVGGGACHAVEGNQGGLDLSTLDAAYAGLVEAGRITAGAAECGQLVERLVSTGAEQMPPGAPLSEAELCAIQQWIQAGAQR